MFYHAQYPNGPRKIVLECEWFENIHVDDDAPDDHTSMLPQVSRNPDSDDNRNNKFIFLDQCVTYNIMLCVHNPEERNCSIYDVIDRHRIFEDPV